MTAPTSLHSSYETLDLQGKRLLGVSLTTETLPDGTLTTAIKATFWLNHSGQVFVKLWYATPDTFDPGQATGEGATAEAAFALAADKVLGPALPKHASSRPVAEQATFLARCLGWTQVLTMQVFDA